MDEGRAAEGRGADKLRRREARLLRLFDLRAGDFEIIESAQGGRCAICGRPAREGKRLHVDHDHLSGLVRGVLCWRCNRALAGFRDDPARLDAAAAYLRRPPAVEALGGPRYGREGRVTNRAGKRRRVARRGAPQSPRA